VEGRNYCPQTPNGVPGGVGGRPEPDREPKDGRLGLVLYQFLHLRADRGTQDVPTRNLQVNRLEHSRAAPHPQVAQACAAFEGTVGTLNAIAATVAFAKDFRLLFPSPTRYPPLLGRMLQMVAVGTLLDGAVRAERTATAPDAFGLPDASLTGPSRSARTSSVRPHRPPVVAGSPGPCDRTPPEPSRYAACRSSCGGNVVNTSSILDGPAGGPSQGSQTPHRQARERVFTTSAFGPKTSTDAPETTTPSRKPPRESRNSVTWAKPHTIASTVTLSARSSRLARDGEPSGNAYTAFSSPLPRLDLSR
jgi:hypothetical protein